MTKARQLFELQRIDREIESRSERLDYILGHLTESEALLEARRSFAATKEHLNDLELEEHILEWDADSLLQKAIYLDAKLYDGSVTNPRELTSLQEETEQIKARRREKEEKALNIIIETETLKKGLEEKKAELDRLEREWQEEQESLLKEQEQLTQGLASLRQQRAEFTSQIEVTSLNLYETLRATKEGRAVAKVEQGMCQGCRITLPMSELQRVRTSQELVQCGSCGRILYIS